MPSCVSCATPGATLRCSSCSRVAYCNKTCQKLDWKEGHSAVCKLDVACATCGVDVTPAHERISCLDCSMVTFCGKSCAIEHSQEECNSLRSIGNHLGAKASHSCTLSARNSVEGVLARTERHRGDSHLEGTLAAMEEISASSESLLSMLWDYLKFVTTQLRDVSGSFTWKVLLNNTPFQFGAMIDLAYRIGKASIDKAGELISQFAEMAIRLFDWMVNANLMTATADEKKAAQEKDVLIETATRAGAESHGLARIIQRGGAKVLSIGRAFVAGLSYVLSSFTALYNVAIDTASQMIGTSMVYVTEWTISASRQVAETITRFVVFAINAMERIKTLTALVAGVAAEGISAALGKFRDAVSTAFGTISTHTINFLRELMMPVISAKQNLAKMGEALGRNKGLNGIYDGVSGLASLVNAIQWMITLYTGGMWPIATQVFVNGFIPGAYNAAMLLVNTAISGITPQRFGDFLSVQDRLVAVRALQTTTAYNYLRTSMRKKVERLVRAVESQLEEISAGARKRIRSGELLSMISASLTGAWESSRGAARMMWNSELSSADKADPTRRAGDLLFATTGQIAQLDALEIELVKVHHELAVAIDHRYYGGVQQIGEDMDAEDMQPAAANARDESKSPPLYIGVAQEAWEDFMDDFSSEYRGPGRLVSAMVPDDPETIRIAYEHTVLRINGFDSLKATREIFAEILRRSFQKYREQQGNALLFPEKEVNAEIEKMRKDPIEVAARAVALQYDKIRKGGKLVVFASKPRRDDQALVAMKENVRYYRNLGATSATTTSANFAVPVEMAAAANSALIAFVEMSIAQHTGSAYYSEQAKRLRAFKPIFVAIASVVAIALTASSIMNTKYGFDYNSIGKTDGITAAQIENETDPNLKRLLSMFALLKDPKIIEQLKKADEPNWINWNKWNSMWTGGVGNWGYWTTSAGYNSIVSIADAANTVAQKQKSTNFAASTEKHLTFLKNNPPAGAWTAVKNTARTDGLSAWDRATSFAIRWTAGFVSTGAGDLPTPAAVTNKALYYINTGFAFFATAAIFMSLTIDIVSEIMESHTDIPAGVDADPNRPEIDRRIRKLFEKYFMYGVPIINMQMQLFLHQSNLQMQYLTNLVIAMRYAIPIAQVGIAGYTGDAMLGTSSLTQFLGPLMSALIDTDGVASDTKP